MQKFQYMNRHGYEQLIYFYDKTTGLQAVTCIHNTALGSALGGVRLWNYHSEEDAVLDVMRLARGMTYKAAAAGLNLGGAKTVLIGDAKTVKSEAYFRALGRNIESLNGRYIATHDVNTNTKDLDYIAMETSYVAGCEACEIISLKMTALGAFHGIRAALEYKYSNDSIDSISFAVQGAGKTGYYLIETLVKKGAKKIFFTDLDQNNIDRVISKYPNVEYVDPKEIYSLNVDVFAPCALGEYLNEKTVSKLKAKIIAGTANKVFDDDEKLGLYCRDKDILYAPDFVINAGGLISLYHQELHPGGFNEFKLERDVEKIYNRLLEIFAIADDEKTYTLYAAKIFAKKRIQTIKNMNILS